MERHCRGLGIYNMKSLKTMRLYIYLGVSLLSIFVCACKKKNTFNDRSNVNDTVPMNYSFVEDYNDKQKIDKLCEKILNEGDTIAYKDLKYIYMLSEHSDEFLYISTVMAEKYNYAPAYQTNYDILKPSKQSTLKKFAVYNLIKSCELGNESDVKELEKMFPKGIPKSEEFWK